MTGAISVILPVVVGMSVSRASTHHENTTQHHQAKVERSVISTSIE